MNSHLGRRAFSPMELHALFHGYIYGDEKQKREQPKHWHFWLPLLAYYTGAYSDEIGCLTLDDLVTIDGVEGFQFSTNEKIATRFVPIHSGLWQAGLESYLEFVSTQHQERVLFDLPSKVDRYSEKVRIWFSGEGERLGYMQKCGLPTIDQQGLKTSVSSLRLNFEQQLRIHAIQANLKPCFFYLLGLKPEDPAHDPKPLELKTVIEPLRNINPKAHWQRFLERQSC